MTPNLRSGGEPVYIVYLDDSRQDQSYDRRFQVIAAVIIPDEKFDQIEQHRGFSVEGYFPADLLEKFEFKACDLWHGNPPFDRMDKKERLRIFEQWVNTINAFRIPIVYGCADLSKLGAPIYQGVDPVEIAFRVCATCAENWFVEKAPDGLGLFISDAFSPTKRLNGNVMHNAFRKMRRNVVSSPAVRGELAHFHDDMYFGDSKYSIGIQLADMCAFLISRKLCSKNSTEALYRQIDRSIFASATEEKWCP